LIVACRTLVVLTARLQSPCLNLALPLILGVVSDAAHQAERRTIRYQIVQVSRCSSAESTVLTLETRKEKFSANGAFRIVLDRRILSVSVVELAESEKVGERVELSCCLEAR
jgi:hypothetical protein